jgi:tRNA(fMet)-specific endonuclease VapC
MSFLIDTDICSAYLRSPGPLFHRFIQHAGHLNISAITLAELFAWTLSRTASPRYLAGLNDLLRGVNVLDFDQTAARRFGDVRSQLAAQRLAPPSVDLLIAATALAHGLTVVTHNVVDFNIVPGLQVIDWLAP